MRELNADEFIDLRRAGVVDAWSNGVYLLGNRTNGQYYVGKSNNVKNRIFAHLSGRGSGDVYADFRAGDSFIVRYYPFDENQFRTIDELEFHLIRIYECFEFGYNRQRGNKLRV